MDAINIVLYDYFHWTWTDFAVVSLIFGLCLVIVFIYERR